MSQTESNSQNSSTSNDATNPEGAEERIRKIYAKDVKVGDSLHTVFRATKKEPHTSRAGKKFLAVTLVDRTGEIDARIFDNVDAADGAFAPSDFLLVQGKVGTFHGKAQLVIDRLERLDPEPIDPKEFTFVAPPPQAAEERPEKPQRKVAATASDEFVRELKLPRRVQKMLENPQVAQAVEALLGYIERMVDERIALKLGGPAPEKTEPRTEKRRERGPRVEHRTEPRAEPRHEPKKTGPRRDPSLPEGLAFKPFKQLVGEDAPPAVAAAEALPEAPAKESTAEPTQA